MPKIWRVTNSAEETQRVAREYLRDWLQSNVLALYGNLGAGKTTFVQGLAKALGLHDRVVSPTFILMRSYKLPARFRQFVWLHHIDLYRVGQWEDLRTLDLVTLWQDQVNLIVIEWPERIADYLPSGSQQIFFEHQGENQRKISWPHS